MAGSLNRVEVIGNLGKDPEIKSMQNGDKVANLSIACSETWKDRNGDKQERTTWVPVVIWGPLAEVAEKYLRKGSKAYVAGKFSVRKWQDRDGQDRYSTEVVLQGPQAQLILLGDGGQRSDGGSRQQSRSGGGGDGWTGGEQQGRQKGFADDLDDDIPFITRNSVW